MIALKNIVFKGMNEKERSKNRYRNEFSNHFPNMFSFYFK